MWYCVQLIRLKITNVTQLELGAAGMAGTMGPPMEENVGQLSSVNYYSHSYLKKKMHSNLFNS